MSSQTQKALFLNESKGSFSLSSRPVPQAPGSDEILVKILASGLNPVDYKIQDYGAFVTSYPSVLGTDIAGTVEKVGADVSTFKVGDRVLHQGTYNNNDRGGFQEYALVKAVHAAKIPEVLTFDQAASIPVAITASTIGLYMSKPQGAGYTAPWDADGKGKYAGKPILVLGGSTSVGQYVIQLAVLSGFSPIITTASPKHEEHLKSLGATHVLDRSAPLDVSKITPLPIEIAFDTVSLPETQNVAYAALASGGQLAILLPTSVKDIQEDKTIVNVLGLVSIPSNAKVGEGLYGSLETYLAAGTIVPNRVEIIPGGLNGVVSGLARLKKGEVSGVKLVVRPQETS